MSNSAKPDKFCGQCGQKNFRPNRSLKELFTEFVEDWLGYDSKIYKTTAKLAKPAALSLDYFANSHHKNHYITPIRLYLLLSIIFFLVTNFGGLSLTAIEFNDVQTTSSNSINQDDKAGFTEGFIDGFNGTVKAAPKDPNVIPAKDELSNDLTEDINNYGNDKIPSKSDPDESQNDPSVTKDNNEKDQNVDVSISGQKQFTSKQGCLEKPENFFNIWPNWLDKKLDKGVKELCDSYSAILTLPDFEKKIAKRNWGLSIGQKAIEMLPQVFFLSLPLLALVLGVFYFLSKRLYVEHLVLLMHSHSFIFSVVLIYLGWYKLTQVIPILGAIWMEEILLIGVIIYLYLSQMWFYQRGWWATLWRFIAFGFLYFILISILTSLGIILGIVLGAS